MDLIHGAYDESDTSDSDVDDVSNVPLSAEQLSNSTASNAQHFSLEHSIANAGYEIVDDSPESEVESDAELSDTESVRTTFSSVSKTKEAALSPYDGFKADPLDASALNNVRLPASSNLLIVAKVRNILDNIVVVESVSGSPTLHLDSVLFLDRNRILGRVFDVFGPVIRPLYSVRFRTAEEALASAAVVGAEVFIVPTDPHLTSYVFENELRRQKGTDASWEDDHEAPEGEEEFSDDEKEKEAKRRREKERLKRTVEGKPVLQQQSAKESKSRNRRGRMPVSKGAGEPEESMGSTGPQPFGGLGPQLRPNLPMPSVDLLHSVSRLNVSSVAESTDFPSHFGSHGSLFSASAASGSSPLVTDPKKLPSAAALFYDPKKDPTLGK